MYVDEIEFKINLPFFFLKRELLRFHRSVDEKQNCDREEMTVSSRERALT